MIKICLLAFLALVLSLQTSKPQPDFFAGKFVAYDTLQGLTNPREPRQLFIVEVQEKGMFAKGQMLKVVYFAPSTSIRGGARLLDEETLKYANTWTLKVHKPSTENERVYCADVDNFFRAADGTIDENEKHESILRFRSTQFKADIKFDDLSGMPCLILDSLEHHSTDSSEIVKKRNKSR